MNAIKTTLRPYFSILRKNLTGRMQYRAGTWTQLLTNAFWGCARSAIIVAFYRYGSGTSALTMQQAVTMIWVQQIGLNLLPGAGGLDQAVWNKIVRGDVGYELLRPMDVYAHWYMSAAAGKIAPFLLAVIPMTITGLLVPGDIGMGLPVSLPHLLACLLTLTTGLMISCAVILISYAMLMNVGAGTGPANIFMYATQILAGSVLPLQLWPESIQTLMKYQPFSGMLDLPLRFFVGSEPLTALPGVLMMQLFWAAALILTGRLWIGRNLARLTIQGG